MAKKSKQITWHKKKQSLVSSRCLKTNRGLDGSEVLDVSPKKKAALKFGSIIKKAAMQWSHSGKGE